MQGKCKAHACRNQESDAKTNEDMHFHCLPIKRQVQLKQWLANLKLKIPPGNKYARLCNCARKSFGFSNDTG